MSILKESSTEGTGRAEGNSGGGTERDQGCSRGASLGVIEAAIQRELEDERIAAQLRIDLRKAGGDQEAIDAAHARAADSYRETSGTRRTRTA